MAKDGSEHSGGHSSDWFTHDGLELGELESVTSSSLKHVLNSVAAVGQEHRMPLQYKARVQKAGNNNFPFSSHDNRHDICNAVEYFDLGMGVRKLDPEKQRQNSHNFFEWSRAPGRSSREGFVTVYQSTFVSGQSPENDEQCHRRYPKHHCQSHSDQEQRSSTPATEDETALKPSQTPETPETSSPPNTSGTPTEQV
ncbi:hypothetical protein EK904_004157 [Melospiza melodia maxima]|uniref:testis-expressed protein 36 n=1 Tax=Melospiza melodia melodia TaxID=1914991 RepID=UPI002FD544B8|nr:hypothetical protein EK904_004157 [Melospiza melodia maxima]